jgi:VanZ family protein
MNTNNKGDTMNNVHKHMHLLGCYGIVMTLLSFGIEALPAALMTMALGLIWEVLDQLNSTKMWNKSFFDNRGGSIVDLLWDISGTILGLLVWAI